MKITVLWVIAVVEIVLWLVGIIAGHTLGGFLHILLLLAALAAATELGLNYRRTRHEARAQDVNISHSRPAA